MSGRVTYRVDAARADVAAEGLFAEAVVGGEVVATGIVAPDGALQFALPSRPSQSVLIRLWALWAHHGLPRLVVVDPTTLDRVRRWEYSRPASDHFGTLHVAGDNGAPDVVTFHQFKGYIEWFEHHIGPTPRHPKPITAAVGIDIEDDCSFYEGCFGQRRLHIEQPIDHDFGPMILLRRWQVPAAAHEFGHAIHSYLLNPHQNSNAPPGTTEFSEGFAHFVLLLQEVPLDSTTAVLGGVDFELPDPRIADPEDEFFVRGSIIAALWDLVDDTPSEDPVRLGVGEVFAQLLSPAYANGAYGGTAHLDFLASFVCSGAVSAEEMRDIAQANHLENYEDPSCDDWTSL